MENIQTLSDIELQIEKLQEQAARIRSEELATVVSEINQKIAAFGLRPGDLKFKSDMKIESAKVGKKAEIKFRDNSGNTWSGRGLKPKWLSAAIAGGKDLSEFSV